MKKHFALLMAACLCLSFSLAGCAPKIGANDYNAKNIGAEQRVEYGTIREIRTVKVEGDNAMATSISTIGGGVAGGVLGSLIGGGSGRTVAAVGGAVLGTAAGYGGSKLATRQDGYEITIDLESGETIAVTQGTDISFAQGQKVRILNDGTRSRVLPLK